MSGALLARRAHPLHRSELVLVFAGSCRRLFLSPASRETGGAPASAP